MVFARTALLFIFLILLGLSGVASGQTVSNTPAPLAVRSIGLNALTVMLGPLAKARSQPSARSTWTMVTTRLGQLMTGTTNAAKVNAFRPVLDDLLSFETSAEFFPTVTNRLDFLLANAGGDHSAIWSAACSNLWGNGIPSTINGFSVITWPEQNSVLLATRNWMLWARGSNALISLTNWVTEFKKTGRPVPPLQGPVFSVQLDTAAFPKIGSVLHDARIDAWASPQGNDLHLALRADYPGPVSWQHTHYALPNNLISGPLSSFSFGQDLGAFASFSPLYPPLTQNPYAGILFSWALESLPLASYAAWPLAGTSNDFRLVLSNAPAAMNPALQKLLHTDVIFETTPPRLVLQKLRVLFPTLQFVHQPETNYGVLAMFPRNPSGKPVPDSLWKQLAGRDNLVYYDWENTGLREQQWRLLGSILLTGDAITSDESYDLEIMFEQWLSDNAANLGPTVTEITRESPTRLNLVRNGPCGLTAFEIFCLYQWLCRSEAVK